MYRLSWIFRASLLLVGVMLLIGGESVAADKVKVKKKGKADVALPKVAPNQVTPVAALPKTAVAAPELAKQIDRHIDAQLLAANIPASPRSDDSEFIRRVYLDITGVIPPASRVAEFLSNSSPDKRAKLIDEVLASSRFGFHQADYWTPLLYPRTSDNRRVGPTGLFNWLEKEFNSNTPWDQLVTKILTVTGSIDQNPAGTFFIGNPTADKMTDSVGKLFMGVQLQCAQCHNHPFTNWKQTDYWHTAAFFMKVRTGNAKAKDAPTPEVSELNTPPRQRQNALPESAKILPPKYLLGEQPKLSEAEAYRPVFAKWLTAPENPYFAKAMANRVWASLFGRGLVNPIDDIHEDNPASHPELFAELADQFRASGYDVKFLYRAIMLSEAYQRTSKALSANAEDTKLLSHQATKVMSPEQLFDSLTSIVGSAEEGKGGRAKNVAAAKGQNPSPRARFVAFFGLDENASPVEYQAGIPQALKRMNSAMLNRGIAGMSRGGTVSLEQIFLATLSRRPTDQELSRLNDYIAKQSDKSAAMNDILWAILNSSEFTVVR